MLSYEKIKSECWYLMNKQVFYFSLFHKCANRCDNIKFHILFHEISVIRKIKNYLYKNLNNVENKKNFFSDLHYFKILEYYVYLNFYNKNIKKISKYKILNYFKKKFEFKDLDPIKWDESYLEETALKYIELGKPIEYFYESNLFLFY